MRGVLVTVALTLAACGGPSLTAGVYHDDEARYRVGPLGGGWEHIGVDDNDLAWHHDAHRAVVQVNATCDPYQDTPLTSLTNHLLIGFTTREFHDQRLVELDGREALRSRVTASLDGVPRELLFYVLKKDQCTYDFALVAAPGDGYAGAERDFEAFVQSFTTEVGAAP